MKLYVKIKNNEGKLFMCMFMKYIAMECKALAQFSSTFIHFKCKYCHFRLFSYIFIY